MRKNKIIWSFFSVVILFAFMGQTVYAESEREEISLYATAAALVDAETGRVLYGKNQDTPMAMASTTKIMTCIVILENLDLDEEVSVSAYAASMPKVKLYVKRGEKYKVRNLLFSMMLESHNDSAVVLAEHLGKQYLSDELKKKDAAEFTAEESRQAVAAFAALMNRKAEEIGCTQTYFLTPNGLDATQTITMQDGQTVTREHCTTAAELARIMSYCVLSSPKRDLFREITATPSYSFSENGRSFSCGNHNAFLSIMDGAFSGKTGFTNKAGYCYVGALERDGRTYVVALLACGWPNNKSYKWSDTRELMEFGLANYAYRDFEPRISIEEIAVKNGAAADGNPYHSVSLTVEREGGVLPIRMLACEEENVEAEVVCESVLTAPVYAGEQVGSITYYLTDASGERTPLAEEGLFIGQDVEEKDFIFVMKYIGKNFLMS